MPPDPLTAQCKVVDQLGEDEIYVLVVRGNYNCAVFGELFATAVNGRKGAGVLLDGYARDIKALKEMEIPKAVAGEVIDAALKTIEKENEVRRRLQNGSSLQQAYAEIGAI